MLPSAGRMRFLNHTEQQKRNTARPLRGAGEIAAGQLRRTVVHPIEAAWRHFRKSEHRQLFEQSIKLEQSYLDSIGLKHCPPEVVLPVAVPWNLAWAEARKKSSSAGDKLDAATSILVNTIHVWASYRDAKTIYYIEPALAECLARSPWPEETPARALRLPSRCPILSFPESGAGPATYVAADYDLLTGEEQSGALELRISEFAPDTQRWIPICVLHLNRERLAQCLDAAGREAERHGAPAGEAQSVWRNKLAGLGLTLLLYLAGEPDLVRIVHSGGKPLKAKIARTDPERYRDLAEPIVHVAGRAFARAIERWEIEHHSDESVATGRTIRPHMRRAHSHLYWTGENRKQPRVRFLLPISVKGGALVEEREDTRMATVR
jgi:hypothetical protein